MPDTLSSDMLLLRRAALLAGDIALRYWGKSPRAWEKGSGLGPVSEADVMVNDYLETFLRQARPDYGWLSEESDDDPVRLSCKRVFIIDPIDGTRAFLLGQKDFAISLAIVDAGKVVAGVVFLPARALLYAAQVGGGAYCNDELIQASRTENFDEATFLASKTAMACEERLVGIADDKYVFRPSLAYCLCLVAEGKFDAMLRFNSCWEWDIAAGILICACAGAAVGDKHGAAIDFNTARAKSDGVISATPAIHSQIIARLVVS